MVNLEKRAVLSCALLAILSISAIQTVHATPINMLADGSFEADTPFSPPTNGWTTTGSPIISPYGGSTLTTGSPDAGGGYAVYFSRDSGQQTLSQSVFLNPGVYEIGFDALFQAFGGYHDATITGSIAGIVLASVAVNNPSINNVWYHYQGIANISVAGNYQADFVFQGNGVPANDALIDRVYIMESNATGGVPIPSSVPEPATLLLMGTGIATLARLRRKVES